MSHKKSVINNNLKPLAVLVLKSPFSLAIFWKYLQSSTNTNKAHTSASSSSSSLDVHLDNDNEVAAPQNK